MCESTCDLEIEAQPERFEDRSDGGSPAYNGKKRNQGNAPPFDIRTHLFRMTGVDLTWIDGIDGYAVLKVVSEAGMDMTKWANANAQSQQRITAARSSVAGPRPAPTEQDRSDSAPGTFLSWKKAQMSAPKAVTATAHKLTKLVYSMLRYGQAYVDAGAEYYESQYHHRALRVCQTAGAPTGLPVGAHVQCSGPGCRRAPQPGGSLLKNLVSR